MNFKEQKGKELFKVQKVRIHVNLTSLQDNIIHHIILLKYFSICDWLKSPAQLFTTSWHWPRVYLHWRKSCLRQIFCHHKCFTNADDLSQFYKFCPKRDNLQRQCRQNLSWVNYWTKSPKRNENMTFSYQAFVVKAIILSIKLTDATGCWQYSFQCESIFHKQDCHHPSFSLDVLKTILSLSASVERSQISQRWYLQWCQLYSRVRPSINYITLRTRFGKQFLLVTSSNPACMQMSALSLCCMRKGGKGKLICMQKRK